jgi:hypothetical protein
VAALLDERRAVVITYDGQWKWLDTDIVLFGQVLVTRARIDGVADIRAATATATATATTGGGVSYAH